MSKSLSPEAIPLALELIFQALPKASRDKIKSRIGAILSQEVRAAYSNEEDPDNPISKRGKAAAELDDYFSGS